MTGANVVIGFDWKIEFAALDAILARPKVRHDAVHDRLARRIGMDGAFGDLLGGSQVFLHQHRRERQHVADVVEAVAGIVRRKDCRRRGS